VVSTPYHRLVVVVGKIFKNMWQDIGNIQNERATWQDCPDRIHTFFWEDNTG